MSRTKPERVLYVEDDPDIRAVAQIALEIVGGLNLRACSSGIEALQAAESFRPDLLMFDVMIVRDGWSDDAGPFALVVPDRLYTGHFHDRQGSS